MAGNWAGVDRRGGDRRRGSDRRQVPRGVDRRRADRRAVVLAIALLAAVPAAQADVFTRRGASGVLEATNQQAPGFALAYRSKGQVFHSPAFRPGSAAELRWDAVIREAAERERLDPALVRAVVRVESAFDERAVSSAGARGLMQLMPDTARRFGVADPFDGRANVGGGTRYLKLLLRMFDGDVGLALAAYNAGEGAVKRHGGIPPYRETRDYVRKVRTLLRATEAPPPTGMMTFTPGEEGRTSAAITTSGASDAAPARRGGLYRWRDERGVLHLTETPPAAGVRFDRVGGD